MPKIELPTGLSEDENLPKTRTALLNCFNNAAGSILPRPGITQRGSDFTNNARGSFEWNGSLYGVWGNELRKVTDLVLGTTSLIGTIDDSEVIETAVGFNHAVIVVNAAAGKIYTLSTSDTLTDISGNSNFVPCRDVAHINGRFVYIPHDGDPAFFSDVGAAGTVQAESFFDAEELPDKNRVVFDFGNTLYIGGTDSIELYRDTGAFPVPFSRISGASLRFGFIGGLQEYVDTFLFLGREKGQDFGFYAIASGQAQKFSNPFIDKILTTYTEAELGACVPGRIKWRGYDIATFTLSRDSFGFLKGQWFRLDTVVDGASRAWKGGFITELGTKYYTASEKKLGIFEDVNTDFGQSITRQMDFGFRDPNNDSFTCQSIELGLSQGFNTGVKSVGLFLSRDNVNYSEGLYRDLGALGEYETQLTWNFSGGLGTYDGFMGIRIYTTQDLFFGIDSMFLNFR